MPRAAARREALKTLIRPPVAEATAAVMLLLQLLQLEPPLSLLLLLLMLKTELDAKINMPATILKLFRGD